MDQHAQYRLRICNSKEIDWAEWFDGFTVEKHASGEIDLIGQIKDQSAVHGVLNKVRDLGFTLISIERLDDVIEQDGGQAD